MNAEEHDELFGKRGRPGYHHGTLRSALHDRIPDLMQRAANDETAIVYRPRYREFGIPILDGATSVSVFKFDPYTGAALPANLRELRDAMLDGLGLTLEDDPVPETFGDERWWIERGL
jgi:hypothetical protein